jgi:hypothetical protein
MRWHEVASDVLIATFGRTNFDRMKAAYWLGYIPHIRRPRTFNEKILHRKLVRPAPNSELLCDKWRAREFVRERVGEEILNEVYCVANRVDDIDFASLPDDVVLKMNNASSRNIFVRSWREADIPGIQAQLEDWLKNPIGHRRSEEYYTKIPPVVMVEKFLHDENGNVPQDFKLFVFHGRCEFIEVHSDRFSAHKARIYNREWEPQPFHVAPFGPLLDRPAKLDEMMKIAERLGQDIDHVRVDLFDFQNRIVFCEFTLTQGAGYMRFHPKEADFWFGQFWHIDDGDDDGHANAGRDGRRSDGHKELSPQASMTA